jgi:hypothetical protein
MIQRAKPSQQIAEAAPWFLRMKTLSALRCGDCPITMDENDVLIDARTDQKSEIDSIPSRGRNGFDMLTSDYARRIALRR